MVGTITITFGGQVENHVGMQKIGKISEHGLDLNDLKNAKKIFENAGYKCDIIHLNKLLDNVEDAHDAYVLFVKNGTQFFIQDNKIEDLYNEQKELCWDKKAYMYGRVVNKKARYNLCYDDKGQEPDYENKRGRVVSFDKIPLTQKLQKGLENVFGNKAKDLKAEGNYYYIPDCGIGWHGDAERRIVIASRLGDDASICYQWFKNSKKVGEKFSINVSGGDLYAMSEKATGFDWKTKKIFTLRHSAGGKKYTQ